MILVRRIKAPVLGRGYESPHERSPGITLGVSRKSQGRIKGSGLKSSYQGRGEHEREMSELAYER